MSFRIDPKKPFSEEVRRLGLALIGDAIAILGDNAAGSHAAVHEARKRFKRLRALYRLLRSAAPAFVREENARIRDIARSFAVARDATALVETAEYLETFARSDAQGDALRSITAMLRIRRDDILKQECRLGDAMSAAVDACKEARKKLGAVSLPDELKATTRLVRTEWSKQGKKARKALAHCHEQAGVEHFHDLRKASQAYGMHLGLMRSLWPSAMRAKRSDAKRLVSILGHEHDLSVLAAVADREPDRFGNGERLALLLDAIIERQQALRAEALELADEVFSGLARKEGRIVGLLWRQAAK